ncbi:MAG TPA: pilus assembly protein [Mesorhizobium sp.]|jgi:Flp pilus assembly protein TadG|uniref:pilus assembly protein n=1 Tax=Mesorhizobium sp. TaxID=1871066 RepID=UPI002DDCC01D|nr:pilus assembly protein [Mesorhizobium sp.]HEV2504979.1 pilus assembly protein [Mesorhizobium sp.]
MMFFGRLLQLVGRFGRDRGGNFLVMAGVVLGVLALAVGFAVDIGQMMNARSALGNAIDAAVTSTARDLTTGTATEAEATKIIKVYLDANSGGGVLAGNQIVIDKVTLDRTKYTLQVSAYVDVPLYFPVFGTEKTRRVSQTGAAVYSFRQLEIAMMLDLTGSMKDGTKVQDLKKAAKDAIDTIFLDQSPTRPRVRVALIPYANAVNVGSSLAASSVFIETKESERKQAPGNTEPRLPSNSSNGTNNKYNCATERKGDYQYTDDGPERSMVNRDMFITTFSGGSAGFSASIMCPKAEIMPLTSDAQALKSRIDSFEFEGGTAGHIGVQWSWYLLSPNWAGALPEAQRPMDYDSAKIGKYAILMTDGLFNLSYFDASTDRGVYKDGKAPPRDAAIKLCEGMRAKGIEIYTIGFDLYNSGITADSRAKAIDLLQKCASPDSGGKHFFDASTGPELKAAFDKIASNMNKLALTK